MTEKKELQVTPPANLTPMEMIQVAFNKAGAELATPTTKE